MSWKILVTSTAICISGAAIVSTGCSTASVTQASPISSVSTDLQAESDTELASVLRTIERSPDTAAGYTKLAAIYIGRARRTGDFSLNSKASLAVDDALKVDPSDITARKLHASLQLTFHRFGEALDLGKKLQSDLAGDAFVYGVLTDANAELGNYEDAVNAAQKMVDLRPNTASYARVGHLRSLYGDHAGAVEMLTLSAKTADPNDKEAQSWCLVQLGDEQWKNGNYRAAGQAYDEALQILPNYYLASTGQGRIKAIEGDMDAAIGILKDAQNRIPNVETIIALGDLYTVRGDLENAKKQYDLAEVVEQKIGLNNDQKRLALLWADHDLRLDDALAIAEREYADRKDIVTADTLAWCRFKKGDIAGAKSAIDDAMKLKTNDARTLYHAALIEKVLGDKAKAKNLLGAALKINPSFDLVQAPIARMELANLR